MDNFSDPALRNKYYKSKLKVKLWESQFRKDTGTNPSKEDIKDAPPEIRDAYKSYWKIKIHSLGQDSLLDATFSEKNISELFSSDKGPDSYSSSISLSKNLQEQSAVSSAAVDDKEESKSSLSDCSNIERTSNVSILANDMKPSLGASNDCVKEESNVEANASSVSDVCDLKPTVWGSHLNKKKTNDDDVSEKRSLNRSSSFQLSEKLFVGAKLKKRNPRKSLSFSVGRSRESTGFTSSDSLPAQSDSSSLTAENSQGQDDGFPISDFADENYMEPGLNFNSPDFVMIKKNIVCGIQPVSAVRKMMEEGSNHMRPKVGRSLDQGWLERVEQADQVEKNGSKTGLTENIPPMPTSTSTEDSDDDFIYGSDNDCNSPPSLQKRANIQPTLSVPVSHQTPSSQISTSTTQISPDRSKMTGELAKSDGNDKKRKVDAIEAAMAVLSERRKSDRIVTQASKRSRRAIHEEQGEHDVGEVSCAESKECAKSKNSKSQNLEKRIASGSINDNYIRINMKKKVFVRGKKTMNFQKYKKQQWKKRKKELSDEASAFMSRLDPSDSAAGGGLQKCFQCGEVGHFARQCKALKGDSLIPCEENDDESPFPSLDEVARMAYEKKGFVHYNVSKSNLGKSSTSDNGVNPAESIAQFKSDDCITDQRKLEKVENSQLKEDDDKAPCITTEPVYESEVRFAAVEPLYPLNPDGSVGDTPAEVYDCLYKFGHKTFRPGQEEAVMRILSGLPTLVTLSTGSGKSLCYQLPAYLYARKRKSLTLVVSPLVSLMDDQISGLPSFINGAALHTGQTEKQREKVMDLVKSGKLQFLLVSPEAIVAGERRSGFGSLLRSLPNIAFACIDEAHCVSQWSHNFRPSYLVIFKVLREKLGVQTILGLTATATQTAVTSIIEHLNIPDGRRGVIQDTPLPNNLLLTVSKDSDRDQALLALLSSHEFKSYNSVIVYCTRREECERIAVLIRTCLKNPIQGTNESKKMSVIAEAYHAGLSSTRRKQVQAAFMSGKLRIVVATVAFGMGINKVDIRSVIHFNMPCNFESYVQEVGRAGRDGQVSHCHLFLNSEGKDLNELRRHIFANSVDRHTIRKLLQRVFLPCKCSENPGNLKKETASFQCEEKVKMAWTQDDVLQPINPGVTLEKTSSGCAGHEVAFSVEETVSTLDLPEENITTLLCYLELYDKNLLAVLPKAYTSCKVQSYKGMRHIREVARSCPPLAMAIAMDIMSGGLKKNKHFVEFLVVDIASIIGWSSGIVKKELMNLEWTNVNGQSRRSGIKVEFSNLGFRVKTPGNLPPEKLDDTLDFLHKRVCKQEESALHQLQTIFHAVTSVSFRDVGCMMKSSELGANSDKLKSLVRAYFQEERKDSIAFKSEEILANSDRIANDIRQMVNMYRDTNFTGRAIARIFHGISSPNFPPQVWGRCRFWRAHLESDFKLICLLATRILLQMR